MVKQVACAYCGKEGVEMHRDHVVPRSRGGPDNAFNIVMACVPCNMEKGSDLPSEWLGTRCPDFVAGIEKRVNRKLKARFRKRDNRKTSKEHDGARKYVAFHRMQNGGIDYIGEVISESESRIRMEVLDAVMATGCGMWWLSENIQDCPRAECELWLFEDRIACLEKALRTNARIHQGKR